MSILTWIEDKKRLKVLNAPKHVGTSTDSSKGLWTRCDKCGVILYIKHLKENQRVCFGCSYHLQMMSGERIENLLDRVPAISSLSSPSQGIERGVESAPSSASSFFRGSNKYLSPRGKKVCTPASKGEVKRGFKDDPKTVRGKALKNSGLFFPGVGAEGDVSTSIRSGIARSPSRESMVSTWRPLDETVSPCDPLNFHDQKAYRDRLQDAQERTGLQDAIQTGTGMIDGIPVALAVMDFSFMGGSMGSVVGEKITRLIEYATQEGVTLLIISASGGARMQEGVFSLMQMAKISSALQIYQSCARLLYISILTSPTTGGVTASFAMLGDIIFAEPKALIAFAGRRVIEQTLREDLPDDFQTSEYMLHHGLVDLIVPRRFLRQALSESIRLYQGAPFKKKGEISFGVQNPISFLTEEKVRRQWGRLTKPGTKAFYSHLSGEGKGVKSIKENGSLSLTKKDALAFEVPMEQSELSYKALTFGVGTTSTSQREVGREVYNTSQRFVRASKESLLSLGNEISTLRSLNSLHEALQGRSRDQFVEKSRLSSDPPTEMYREILTSFEVMLPLLVSSNSNEQNEKDGSFLAPSYLSSQGQGQIGAWSRRAVTRPVEPRPEDSSHLSSFCKSSKKTANPSDIFWLYNGMVTPSHRHIIKLKEVVAPEEREKSALKRREYKNKLGFFSSKKFLQKSNPMYKAPLCNTVQSASPFFHKSFYLSSKARKVCISLPLKKRYASTYKSNICKKVVDSTYKSFYKPCPCPCPSGKGKGKGKRGTGTGNPVKEGNVNKSTICDVQVPVRHEPYVDLMLRRSNEGDALQQMYERYAKQNKSRKFILAPLAPPVHVHKPLHVMRSPYSGHAVAIQSPLSNESGALRTSLLTTTSKKHLSSCKSSWLHVMPCFATQNTANAFKSSSCVSARTHTCKKRGTRIRKRFVRSFALVLERRFVRSFALVKQRKLLHKKQGEESFTYNGTNVRKKACIYTLDAFVVAKRRFSPCFVYKALYYIRNTTTSLSEKGENKVRNFVWHEAKRKGARGAFTEHGERTSLLTSMSTSSSCVKARREVRKEILVREALQEDSYASASNFYVPFLNPKAISLTEYKSKICKKVIVLSRKEGRIKDGKNIESQELSSISPTILTTQENNISFLNQAIELAATESVEWRAFYIDSGLSENMGSFENFLQQDLLSFEKHRTVLFYKLLCRSKKTISE